ncbi:MAG: hypothetical protein ABJA78_10235, partial [Ferruginibacter sp.]
MTDSKYSVMVNKLSANFKKTALMAAGCLLSMLSFAQRADTTKKPSINITSSYKPVLRNAVKINFSASQLTADTNHSVGKYTIPAQNLFFSYQPISLKPLALEQDTILNLGMRNFIKAGFGNYATPYVSAGFSFGDGKKSLFNLYADYISSKGKIKNQDYSQLHLKGAGSFFMPKNEFYVGAALNSNQNYLYGYDHALHNYGKDSLKRNYQDVVLNAGLRNTDQTSDPRIKYDPNVQVIVFNSDKRASESTIIAEAPADIRFGESFSLKVTAKADITSYTTKDLASNVKISNNVFSIAPSLAVKADRFNINAGIIPTWDGGQLVLLPNVYAEGQLQDKVFLIQAGWVGRYTKNTLRNLTAINPYLQTPSVMNNTKEIEYYGGIKATIGKHFNFNAKAGFITYNNLPFFINDTLDGKSFYVSNEKKVNDLRIHGDLSYVNQDKFTFTTGLTFNGYTGMQTHQRAWGTIPMELNSSLRWWAYKQVLLKADFYMFGGGAILSKGGVSTTGKGGT